MSSAFDKFRDHVISNSLVVPGDRILLAVSAGKDSIAMLHMMQALKSEIDFETGVFHLNHMARGAESDADALFVENTARVMGLFVRLCSVDIRAGRPGGVSFEEFARETRYRLLSETASEHGFNKIATAHSSDDNCETVLMRVLSGTGIRGLRGIPAERGEVIRPMLSCSSAEIYEYLRSGDYEWHEDKSNSDNSFLRNFVRNRLLPLISERFPDAKSSISNLSRFSIEHTRLLDDTLNAAYPGYLDYKDDSVFVSHQGLRGNIPAIRYILSRELNRKYDIKVSIPVLDEIIRNYNQPRSNNTLYDKAGILVKKTHGQSCEILVITKKHEKFYEDTYWEYIIDMYSSISTRIKEAGISLTIEDSDYETFCSEKKNPECVFLSVKPSARSLHVRNRHNGDRIKLGFGSKKIKDLMIEKKLDSDTKNTVPIIVIEDEIAACLFGMLPGSLNRISCNFLACNDSQRIIRINIKADHDI